MATCICKNTAFRMVNVCRIKQERHMSIHVTLTYDLHYAVDTASVISFYTRCYYSTLTKRGFVPYTTHRHYSMHCTVCILFLHQRKGVGLQSNGACMKIERTEIYIYTHCRFQDKEYNVLLLCVMTIYVCTTTGYFKHYYQHRKL